MIRAFVGYASIFVASLPALFRSQRDQALVELALRQQLTIYAQRQPRPRITNADRGFWVALLRFWPRWRSALVVVQPDTVVRWHRKGFRLYWRSLSTPGPGRPRISPEVRELIEADRDVHPVLDAWEPERQEFLQRREGCLLY